MKKIILAVVAIAFIIISMSSCNKQKACAAYSDSEVSTTTEVHI